MKRLLTAAMLVVVVGTNGCAWRKQETKPQPLPKSVLTQNTSNGVVQTQYQPIEATQTIQQAGGIIPGGQSSAFNRTIPASGGADCNH